jgi:hypothetical protein
VALDLRLQVDPIEGFTAGLLEGAERRLRHLNELPLFGAAGGGEADPIGEGLLERHPVLVVEEDPAREAADQLAGGPLLGQAGHGDLAFVGGLEQPRDLRRAQPLLAGPAVARARVAGRAGVASDRGEGVVVIAATGGEGEGRGKSHG